MITSPALNQEIMRRLFYNFLENNLEEVYNPHDDAIVVSMIIGNFEVRSVLIDCWSLPNVLFGNAYEKMDLGVEKLGPMKLPSM